jgi:hypothetical protein
MRPAGWLLAATLLRVHTHRVPTVEPSSPLLVEAQLDGRQQRRAATRDRLPRARVNHGEKVLASMGSLAHYMQELSREGFAIADFIHEGNGALWDLALENWRGSHAGWMLVEEESEGGDVLALARAPRPMTSFEG